MEELPYSTILTVPDNVPEWIFRTSREEYLLFFLFLRYCRNWIALKEVHYDLRSTGNCTLKYSCCGA